MNPRIGCTFKRHGLWGVRITYRDPQTGKRRDLRRTCLKAFLPNTKTAADGELRSRLQREVDIILGAAEYSPHTIHALLDHYERTYVRPPEYHAGKKISGYRSRTSILSYLKTLRRLLPNKILRQVTYEDCRQAKLAIARDHIVVVHRAKKKGEKPTRVERPRSAANVHRILAELRTCLTTAVRQGWIDRNPFSQGEPLIRPSHERQRKRILSPKEEISLLEACTGPRAHLRLIVLGFLDTAMREGELKTRRRRDLDLEAREILIYPEPVASSDWSTKNEEGRIVPMSNRLYDEMIARGVDELRDSAIAFGYGTTIRTAWRTARRLAGLEDLRLHDLRHTAITRLIEDGMELAEVARIAGHKDIRTTYRYVNAHAGTVAKARDLVNARSPAEVAIN